MAELEDLIVRFRAQISELTSGFRKVGEEVKKVTRGIAARFKALGTSLQNVGKELAAKITLPLAAVTFFAVKAASDVEEMRGLLKVTFGQSVKDIQAWSISLGKAVGRSRFELQRFAGDFAAFLKPIGVAPAALIPMTKALTQLTVDVASFRNLTEEDVFGKFVSGLAGETEGLRRLGVDISVVALEQELLSQGSKKNIKDLTNLEKVMLRFSIIVKQTKDAQGDAIRTAGGLANMWRRLQAVVQDISRDFGRRLIPFTKLATRSLTELGQRFLDLSSRVKGTILVIGGIAAIAGPTLIALGLLVSGIGLAAGSFGTFGRVVTRVAAVSIGAMGTLAGALLTPVGVTVASVAVMVAAWFLFRNTVTAAVGGISASFGQLKGEVPDIKKVFEGVVGGLSKSFDQLKGKVPDIRKAFEDVVSGLSASFDELKGKVPDIKAAFAGVGAEGIFTSIEEAVGSVVEVFDFVIKTASNSTARIGVIIHAAIGQALTFSSSTAEAVAKIFQGLSKTEALKVITETFFSTLEDLVNMSAIAVDTIANTFDDTVLFMATLEVSIGKALNFIITKFNETTDEIAAWGRVFGTISVMVEQGFETIVKETETFAERWVVQFQTGLSGIRDSLMTWQNETVQLIEDTAVGIGQGLMTIVAETATFAAQWVAQFQEGLSNIRTSLQDWQNETVDLIEDTVVGIGQAFGSKFDELVVGPARNAVKKVADVFRSLKNTLVGNSIVPEMVADIGAEMSRLTEVMAPPATAAVEKVVEVFGELFAKIKTASKKDVAKIGDSFQDLGARAKEAFAGLSDLIPESVREAFNALFEDLDEGFGSTVEQIKDLAKQTKNLTRNVGDAGEKAKVLKKIGAEAGRAIEDSFNRALVKGESFKGLLASLGETLRKTFIEQAITKPLVGALFKGIGGAFGGGGAGSVLGSSRGNAFSGGRVVKFQRGGVMDKPFSFPLAGGRTGVGAEKGRPEAIIPLTRTSGGDLGVKMAGGGGGANVEVNIFTPPGSEVEQNKREEGGTTRLDIMIDQAVAKKIGQPNSRTFKAMRSTFDLRQKTLGR